jgi:hypothetical protein
MKKLKTLLRGWVLTATEAALLEAVGQAQVYRPDPQLSQEDAEAWEAALRSPVGLKVDTAMINWLHQLAQRAIAMPSAEVLAEAKYALGCRAGWEMAKSIPRLAAAPSSKPEDDASTAAAPLAQHEP